MTTNSAPTNLNLPNFWFITSALIFGKQREAILQTRSGKLLLLRIVSIFRPGLPSRHWLHTNFIEILIRYSPEPRHSQTFISPANEDSLTINVTARILQGRPSLTPDSTFCWLRTTESGKFGLFLESSENSETENLNMDYVAAPAGVFLKGSYSVLPSLPTRHNTAPLPECNNPARLLADTTNRRSPVQPSSQGDTTA
jgi:hypothetical protein